jgi:hypothetical protein
MAAITDTAQRIAHRHNEMRRSGGVLAFDALGGGGDWYADEGPPDSAIVFPIRRQRVDARDVQDWLDEKSR